MNKISIKILIVISFLYLIILGYINIQINNYEKDIKETQMYIIEIQKNIKQVNQSMKELFGKLDEVNNKIPQ